MLNFIQFEFMCMYTYTVNVNGVIICYAVEIYACYFCALSTCQSSCSSSSVPLYRENSTTIITFDVN